MKKTIKKPLQFVAALLPLMIVEYISHGLEQSFSVAKHPCATPDSISPGYAEPSLTEIQTDELYFCLEQHKVRVGDTEIELTVKEFDALYLLLLNRNRVLTFESLAYQIWGEEYVDVTAKTVHNLMSRVRHKLQVSSDTRNYIICVRGVGYKFDTGT